MTVPFALDSVTRFGMLLRRVERDEQAVARDGHGNAVDGGGPHAVGNEVPDRVGALAVLEVRGAVGREVGRGRPGCQTCRSIRSRSGTTAVPSNRVRRAPSTARRGCPEHRTRALAPAVRGGGRSPSRSEPVDLRAVCARSGRRRPGVSTAPKERGSADGAGPRVSVGRVNANASAASTVTDAATDTRAPDAPPCAGAERESLPAAPDRSAFVELGRGRRARRVAAGRGRRCRSC